MTTFISGLGIIIFTIIFVNSLIPKPKVSPPTIQPGDVYGKFIDGFIAGDLDNPHKPSALLEVIDSVNGDEVMIRAYYLESDGRTFGGNPTRQKIADFRPGKKLKHNP